MKNIKFPNFLEDRINKFYEDIIHPRKNKKHLVLGNEILQPDSLILYNNDYLSIGNHKDIVDAQIKTLESSGNGVVMSGVFMQGDCPKKIFEDELANFVGHESAILCQSGYVANVGLIQSLVSKDMPVYIDFSAHTSLWEGIRAADAKTVPFLHNDPKHLERVIKQNGQGLILIDSLYSVMGTIAPIKEIVEISEKYDCILVVDESHSLGTHGKNGAGLVNELGLTDRIHFITASLAKVFAGRAGIVTCSKRFAGYFPFVSYPAIFSSVVLNHEIEGLRATLKIIRNSDEARKKLKENSEYIRENLDLIGYNIESESHIVSIESGLEADTEILRDELEKRGVFGAVFCSPATPKNRSVIRLSINSSLTKTDLDRIIRVCEEIKDIVGMKNWRSTKKKINKSSNANLT